MLSSEFSGFIFSCAGVILFVLYCTPLPPSKKKKKPERMKKKNIG
jgi:hypothetical protein